MSSSRCDHIRELLPAFVNGTLSEEQQQRRVQGHLSGCDACRAELSSWEAVARATIAASEQAQAAPSARVWEGMWNRIERE